MFVVETIIDVLLLLTLNVVLIRCNINEKNAQRRRKHCALAVARPNQNFSPRYRPPSRGCGTAKI